MPTFTMYDSVNVAALPTWAYYAAYVDGKDTSGNYVEVRARFPKAGIVAVTTTGRLGFPVADVENGDLTPAQGAAWAKGELAAGIRPTLYYAKDTASQVAAALKGSGVTPASVDFWVADWTGEPHLVPGSVATQWANPAHSGGDYDISTADLAWLDRVASPLAPTPPAPPTKEGLFMPWLANDGTTTWVVWPDGTKTPIGDIPTAEQMGARFGGPVAVSPQFITEIPIKAVG